MNPPTLVELLLFPLAVAGAGFLGHVLAYVLWVGLIERALKWRDRRRALDAIALLWGCKRRWFETNRALRDRLMRSARGDRSARNGWDWEALR